MDQMPVCCMAQKPEPKFAGASLPPLPSISPRVDRALPQPQGGRRSIHVKDCHVRPSHHMKGYHVKFW